MAQKIVNATDATINKFVKDGIKKYGENADLNYIDVSQVFTINTYQLRVKIGEASQAIVDAAVALHTLHSVNDDSMNTMIKVLKDKFPDAQPFQRVPIENIVQKEVKFTVNNMFSPSTEIFTDVTQVPLGELDAMEKAPIREPINKDEALRLYNDWLKMGTDPFRQKYGLTNQQYYALRDKCVAQLLGKVTNFKKFDWA